MCKEVNGFGIDDDMSTKIWRYIDVEKLESILKEKALYFTSVEELDDKYEGSISDSVFKKKLKLSHVEINDNDFESLKEYHRSTWRNRAFKNLRVLTKINCWHINQYESAAMWKLYKGSGKGIAIQSTIANLCSSFSEYKMKPEYGCEKIWIGKVKYIDFGKDGVCK